MWQLRYLVELMIRDGVLTFAEANLLASAASDADLLNLPLRGRADLTSPAAYDLLVISRSTPPAPIAASCWSSPINRTDAPRSRPR